MCEEINKIELRQIVQCAFLKGIVTRDFVRQSLHKNIKLLF